MYRSKITFFAILLAFLAYPFLVFAQADFNPHFIISDEETQDSRSWTRGDIQNFLDSKGSYLRQLVTPDFTGAVKTAADIIYDAAQNYQINPKVLLVTLQKEQSLITDDAPTQKQLDWATGYAVCDSCSMTDPGIQSHKGFGMQVDNAAGVLRWYYDNKDKSFVKKKDIPTRIDNQEVVPQSWATAFLYTYTPHLHGNQNFWRIWQTWFSQVYPNGSLLQSASSTEVWLIQNGARRKFASRTALITRADPRLVVMVPDIELNNYQLGPEISFPNYSLLKTPATTYLLDYDTLRPFASDEVVRKLGYNPQEIIEVNDADLAGYVTGLVITASTTAPHGVVYQITDLNNAYYLLKDNILTPIPEAKMVEVNFKNLEIEKHKLKDLAQYEIADLPVKFTDGTLLQIKDSNLIYVVDKGQKRRIADNETFKALGYKKSNIIPVALVTAMNIPEGEPLFLNSSLLSAKNKFLGDSLAPVRDAFATKIPAYLVAEYPSGRILAGKNIDIPRPIASLTKILTAYEALNQNFSFTKATVYSKDKFASYDNPLKLVNGEKINNKDLLNVMLVGSVNNVARMVAQNTGLTEETFVKDVNRRLEDWGADYTDITDVTGLDAGNKSTPRDLLKIFTKVLSDEQILKALSQTSYYFKEMVDKNGQRSHTVKNTNQLFSVAGRGYKILASKTGYTDEAGAVMLMLVQSRKNAKQQYIIITMGNNNRAKRFAEPNKLAEWSLKASATMASVK